MDKEKHIITTWIIWHFYEAPKFLLSAWSNYLWFGLEYFSVDALFLTLLNPWHKYQWSYPRGFSFGEYLNVFVSNLVSRIMGALARLLLIAVGAIAQILIFIAGMIVFAAWLLMPVLLVFLVALIFI